MLNYINDEHNIMEQIRNELLKNKDTMGNNAKEKVVNVTTGIALNIIINAILKCSVLK